MQTKTKTRIGWTLTTIATLFMIFDGGIKALKLKVTTDSLMQLGYSPDIAVGLGLVILLCTLLYIIPRTSILGAILMTGFLGGAVATNVRVDSPWLGYILFPVYVAAFIWLGLYFRDERLRALVPLKK